MHLDMEMQYYIERKKFLFQLKGYAIIKDFKTNEWNPSIFKKVNLGEARFILENNSKN